MSHELPRARPAMPPPGTETVLLIEDDVAVLRLLERTLEALGYRVLSAASGGDALAVAAAHAGEIDVVLSDVVLPDISGPETVRRLQAASPHPLATLFMSGHADHPLLRGRTAQEERNFIQKPLTRMAIAHKLREAIDAR